MFDVFTEEVEVLIKDGIANLYWYKGDLHKAWLRSGVTEGLLGEIRRERDATGRELTKRLQMDALYRRLRTGQYERRLEVSRNFVRILVEHQAFTPQDPKHRVEVAERCALKLREIIRQQEKDRDHRETVRASVAKSARENYDSKLGELRVKFAGTIELPRQERGYALEELFTELMRISGIPFAEPFKIEGEQLDGAIKYDGHYYLIELKWTEAKTDPKEIAHFYFKVEGKLGARGFVLSMNGFTDGAINTLPKGKDLKVLLLDGIHLTNVIYGMYRMQELLDEAIRQASLKGNIYCPHSLKD